MNLSSSGGNSCLNCLFFGTFFFGFFMAREFAGLPREWVYVILLSFSLLLSPSVYQFAALSTIYSLDLSSRARSYVESLGFPSCGHRWMAHVSPCIARSWSHSGTWPGRWAASTSPSASSSRERWGSRPRCHTLSWTLVPLHPYTSAFSPRYLAGARFLAAVCNSGQNAVTSDFRPYVLYFLVSDAKRYLFLSVFFYSTRLLQSSEWSR